MSYHLSYSECKKILRAPNNVALYNKNLNLDRQDIEKSVKNYEKEYKKTGKKDFKYLAFEPSDELIESSFEILVRSNKSFEKDGKCFLTSIYAAEEFIAKKVSKIAKNTIDFPVVNLDIISKYLKENKIVLEKEQLKEMCIRDRGRDILAVQWHPEEIAAAYPQFRSLFDWLVNSASG